MKKRRILKEESLYDTSEFKDQELPTYEEAKTFSEVMCSLDPIPQDILLSHLKQQWEESEVRRRDSMHAWGEYNLLEKKLYNERIREDLTLHKIQELLKDMTIFNFPTNLHKMRMAIKNRRHNLKKYFDEDK